MFLHEFGKYSFQPLNCEANAWISLAVSITIGPSLLWLSVRFEIVGNGILTLLLLLLDVDAFVYLLYGFDLYLLRFFGGGLFADVDGSLFIIIIYFFIFL